MVKVSVEVRSGTARFRVAVQAESVRRALGLVGERYPASDVGVVFPLEPEGFFQRDQAAAKAGRIGRAERMAA